MLICKVVKPHLYQPIGFLVLNINIYRLFWMVLLIKLQLMLLAVNQEIGLFVLEVLLLEKQREANLIQAI